ncbi:MFS transporter [Streptosporangium sp. 'caverna']|uniref:MFS transporter n=1 Tax=Streptosporangium sp. 'caverna' TaxID=2202249 RepID=UPI000D7E26C1|nr:MFS transporter [Streptosporangium sp. 'caverna']AWS43367.1 MFS transporter [Streptosporangium sp. 'caverna']
MSSPSRPPSYLVVLRTPQTCRAFGAALLGRLSYGTVFLSLVLALTAATGSYAVAGGVMALFGLASSLLSPLRAGLIDRYGSRRALPPMAVLYALLLTCLAAATWQPGTSGALLAALAVAAGACTPPLGPVMRALWSDLLPDRQLLQRAYSLDTVAEESLFVTGPLLAGLLAAFATPAAGVGLSAVLVLTGTFAFVLSPAVRTAQALHAGTPHDGPRTDPAPSTSRWRWMRGAAGLGRPVAVSAAVGLCLGALSLLMVVFAERYHQAAAVAWVEAALSVGSAVGGLAYGAFSWRVSGQVRLPVLAAALGLTLAAAGLSPNLYVLVAVVGVAGLFVAPVLTTAYLLADESAAPHNRTRAGAWVNTAFNTGSSSGTATIGLLVGSLPLALCFAVVAVPPLLAAATALGRPRPVTVSTSSRDAGKTGHDPILKR